MHNSSPPGWLFHVVEYTRFLRERRTGQPGLMPAYHLACVRFSPRLYLICKDSGTKERPRSSLWIRHAGGGGGGGGGVV